MNYSRITLLINKPGVRKIEVAQHAGMKSTEGLRKAIENKSLSVSSLEGIAQYFNIPIIYFFETDENQLMLASEPESKYVKKKYIEDRLNDVEREIREIKKRLKK